MVFGVFDRLHPGHISFLEQAKKYGDILIAVVTRDLVVEELKKKLPDEGEGKRRTCVQDVSYVTHAVFGDETLSSYEVIKSHQPDMICLGYDQEALAQDLRARMDRGEIAPIELAVMEPHEAERFHTSLLTGAA